MKKTISTILQIAAAVTLLSATTLFAQQPKISAKVPFEFVAGGKTLPAGEYTIERLSNSAVSIADTTGNVHLVVQSSAISKSGLETPAAGLVFERSNGKAYLSQVWTGNDRNGRQLAQTRRAADETFVAQGR